MHGNPVSTRGGVLVNQHLEERNTGASRVGVAGYTDVVIRKDAVDY